METTQEENQNNCIWHQFDAFLFTFFSLSKKILTAIQKNNNKNICIGVFLFVVDIGSVSYQ